MSGILNVACVQNCASNDLDGNLARLEGFIAEAADGGATFVSLPEACEFLSPDRDVMKAHARPAADHLALQRLTACAQQHEIWLLIGSLTMRDDDGAMVNRSLLVGPDGNINATYDKIHMFDANVPGMKKSRESDLYRPGKEARLAALPGAVLGMTICYDLRFPHLYRSLAKAGATIMTVPAAFMKMTGEAHWHVLLRARAIENGCFVIAPAQWGNPYGARLSYGHSLIIDPWGRILADAGGGGEGVVMANLDMQAMVDSRNVIMSLDHDRPFSAPEPLG